MLNWQWILCLNFLCILTLCKWTPPKEQIKTILNSKRLLFWANDAMEYCTVRRAWNMTPTPPICLIHLPVGEHPLCPCFSCLLKSDSSFHPSSTSWFNLSENIYSHKRNQRLTWAYHASGSIMETGGVSLDTQEPTHIGLYPRCATD